MTTGLAFYGVTIASVAGNTAFAKQLFQHAGAEIA